VKESPCQVVSTAELSRITGYTETHIARLVHSGMPKIGRARFDLAQAVKWMLTRKERSAGDTITDARTRLIEEQIEGARLDNERLRGELLQIEDVQHVLQAQAVTVATQLEGLAPRIAYELAAIAAIPAPQIQEIVFRECRAIRESIADAWEAYRAPDTDGGEDNASAAAPAGRRVGRPAKVSAARKPRARAVAQ
jgi:phage terminase Nu1 subunit (DNA packaging protein)